MQTGGLVLMAVLVAMPAAAQDIRGDWHGALEVEDDAPLRLALHIASGNSAKFKATLVSIDEDGTTLAVDSVYANGSIIRFEMKDVGGTYEGRITAGGSIAGSWRQNGGTWPLTWERGGDPADIVELFDGEKTLQEGRLYAQCFYDGKFSDLWAKLSPVMQQALVRADNLRDLRVQVEHQFGSETNVIEETVKRMALFRFTSASRSSTSFLGRWSCKLPSIPEAWSPDLQFGPSINKHRMVPPACLEAVA